MVFQQLDFRGMKAEYLVQQKPNRFVINWKSFFADLIFFYFRWFRRVEQHFRRSQPGSGCAFGGQGCGWSDCSIKLLRGSSVNLGLNRYHSWFCYLHVDSVHKGFHYACDQCDYKATNKNNLKMHVDCVHEAVCYSCNKCNYTSKNTHLIWTYKGFYFHLWSM